MILEVVGITPSAIERGVLDMGMVLPCDSSVGICRQRNAALAGACLHLELVR